MLERDVGRVPLFRLERGMGKEPPGSGPVIFLHMTQLRSNVSFWLGNILSHPYSKAFKRVSQNPGLNQEVKVKPRADKIY